MASRIIATTCRKCPGCEAAIAVNVAESSGWKFECPKCHAEQVFDVNARTNKPDGWDIHAGNRNFYGKESVSFYQGCHPKEVKTLKRMVGPSFESCVKDDGSVVFKNRQQERGYVKALEQAKARRGVV